MITGLIALIAVIVGGLILKTIEAHLTAPHSRTLSERKIMAALSSVATRPNRNLRPAVASDLPMPEQFDPHWTVTQELDIWGYVFTKCECTKCEIRETELVQRDAARQRELVTLAGEKEKQRRPVREKKMELPCTPVRSCLNCGIQYRSDDVSLCVSCRMNSRKSKCNWCDAMTVEEICVDCFNMKPKQVPVNAHLEIEKGWWDYNIFTWTNSKTGETMYLRQARVPEIKALEFDKPEFDYVERGNPKARMDGKALSRAFIAEPSLPVLSHSWTPVYDPDGGALLGFYRYNELLDCYDLANATDHVGPTFDEKGFWHPCPCDECDPVIRTGKTKKRAVPSF